ncbi:MAG: hypothetical protein PF450_16760 [Bacteroidales bacterium]|nr:hypothetical protein [Bacteroidales bacterium]
MKRAFLILLFFCTVSMTALPQVINFAKTLPTRAFSVSLAPLMHVGGTYHPNIDGLSYMLLLGYGIGYDVDISLKYGNSYSYAKNDVTDMNEIVKSPDFFAIDMQYLFRETRSSYYSLFGGIHKWDEYGIDLTFSYTHMPQYFINLTAGLDLDVDFTNTRALPHRVNSPLELRAWVPLSVGFNFDDRYYLFVEYDLPATEAAWDILGGGITFIFR